MNFPSAFTSLINVGIGLLALSFLVIIHELGHYGAARRLGVVVEVFSLGWGRRLLRWQRGETEWRLSLLPLGGYCKMRGEEGMLPHAQSPPPNQQGSFMASSPWKRILISFSGPLANLLSAVLFSALFLYADTSPTYFYPSRLTLPTKAPRGGVWPAKEAGLQTGDRILAINGKKIESFSDLQERVLLSPSKRLMLTVLREGRSLSLPITPVLDETKGGGYIGVSPWIDPVIASLPKGKEPREGVPFLPGDRITAIGGLPIRHIYDAFERLEGSSEDFLAVSFVRENQGERVVTLPVPQLRQWISETQWKREVKRAPSYHPGTALLEGVRSTGRMLVLTWESFQHLFSGVTLRKVVAGPLRISYLAGQVATSPSHSSPVQGILTLVNLLSFLSVALFVMNLLPFPVLDGGQILFFALEGLRGKPFSPKTRRWYNLIGAIMLFALLFIAVVSDVLFFTGD